MGLCRDYGTAPRSLSLHIYCYEKIEKKDILIRILRPTHYKDSLSPHTVNTCRLSH